jgi:polyisoprenoid-binding protein YceI
VKLSLFAKIGAAIAVVAILAAAGAITLVIHGRPQPLGLAQTGLGSPAPSPSPDDPLALTCRRPAVPGNSPRGVAGLWTIQPASVAGYRAHEKFADLTSPHEAVARTDRLSGWILVASGSGSTQLVTGCVAVDVRTLHSVDVLPGFNRADRDRSASDFLSAGLHPFVVFQPYPAPLALDPNSGAVQHVRISGDLQISGVTGQATFSLDLQLNHNQLTAAGSTTVQAGDFGVQVPQGAGGFVSVDPNITLEVSLILLKP